MAEDVRVWPSEAEKLEEAARLTEAMEKSSDYVHKYFIFVMSLLFYVILQVLSTTDLQLLMPQSVLKIPLLNLDLPVIAFYIVAPLLALATHYYLLVNLLSHSRRLFAWDEVVGGDGRVTASPFLLNQVILSNDDRNIFACILKAITVGMVFILPLFALVLIQWRFSAYHSLEMTSYHFITVGFDVFFLFLYRHRITRKEMQDEAYNSLWTMAKVHADAGLLSFYKIPFVVIAPILGIAIAPIVRSFYIIPFVAGAMLLWILWKVFRVGRDLDYGDLFLKKLRKRINIFFNLDNIHVWVISLAAVFNLVVTILVISFTIKTNWGGESWIVPHLELKEQTLVASPPSDTIIQAYLMTGKTKDDAWKDYAKGLDLHDRNLNLANFYKANLSKADLRDAHLEGAVLWDAHLEGADLEAAHLQGADLGAAHLEGAYLGDAHLEGADLGDAHLEGAYLGDAHLEGAYLMAAHLEGAYLGDANLEGADLGSAHLEGADLRSAHLEGANLSGASLAGAFMDESYLSCVELKDSKLEGIFFKNIDTATTTLDKAFKDPIPPDNTIYNQNATAAKKRCKKFDAKAGKDLTDTLTQPRNNNRDKFIEARKKLSCTDYNIAKNLLSINNYLNETSGIKIDYAPYMQKNCPALYNRLNIENPNLFKLPETPVKPK
jgi:uncharacterized protein YjbI with pentapeptide repeats